MRRSSIWRTDSCLVSGPAAACHRLTVCKYALFMYLCALPHLQYSRYILQSWPETSSSMCFSFSKPNLRFSCSSGINQWRDQLKPSQILENVARVRGVPPPRTEGDGSSLSFLAKQYNLQDFGTAILTFPIIIFFVVLLLIFTISMTMS